MAEKVYKLPAITWLRMTDYTHGWLQYELGSGARIKEQKVVSVQHLPGAREVLRMETVEDMLEKQPLGNALSGVRKNMLQAGLEIDPDVMEREYGVTKELLRQFVPIECPKLCLTKHGVLRPWNLYKCFGKEQARALQKILRQAFWEGVAEFNAKYARQMDGKKYPAVEMVEAFCEETNTPDMYIDAIRNEWQRRLRREKAKVSSG